MSSSDISRLGSVSGITPARGPSSETQSGPAKTALNSGSISAENALRAGSAARGGVAVEVSSASANAAAQSTSAPVDTDRVAEIKAALSDGTYPLVPSKIADALIASRFMLSASE